MSDSGKGSNPRPFSVDRKTFDNNWDKIFNKSNALKEMNRISDECGDYITNEIEIQDKK